MFDTPFSCLIFPIVSSSPYASCCPYVISCPVGKSSSSGKMDPKVGFICSDEGPNLIHFGVFVLFHKQTDKIIGKRNMQLFCSNLQHATLDL